VQRAASSPRGNPIIPALGAAPELARHADHRLRVRALEGDGAFSMGELQVFSEIPAGQSRQEGQANPTGSSAQQVEVRPPVDARNPRMDQRTILRAGFC
jgi:hypothetical protein